VKYITSYRVSRHVYDRLRKHAVCLARRDCLHDSLTHGLQVGDEFILSQLAGSNTPGSMHSIRPNFYVTLPVT